MTKLRECPRIQGPMRRESAGIHHGRKNPCMVCTIGRLRKWLISRNHTSGRRRLDWNRGTDCSTGTGPQHNSNWGQDLTYQTGPKVQAVQRCPSETVHHITEGCKILADKAYMECHDQVAGIVHRNICAEYEQEVPRLKWETPPKALQRWRPQRLHFNQSCLGLGWAGLGYLPRAAAAAMLSSRLMNDILGFWKQLF